MPNPQIARAYLQRVALYHMLGRTIADMVAPPFRVPAEEFEYKEWAAEHLAEVDTTWAPGTKPNEMGFRFKTRTAKTRPHKFRVPLTDRERRKAAADGGLGAGSLERRRVAVATGVIIGGYEAEAVSVFTDNANYAAGHVVTKSPGSEWDQAGTTDASIVDDINLGIDTVLNKLTSFSVEDLTIVIPERVWRAAIRDNTVIRANRSGGSEPRVTEAVLKDYFGFGRVLRPTAAKLVGQVNVEKVYETESITTHWGDSVWIGLVGNGDSAGVQADDAGLFEEQLLGFAGTAYWTGDTNGQRRLVREYESADPGEETTYYEVKEDRRVLPLNKLAGYIIKNTLAAI